MRSLFGEVRSIRWKVLCMFKTWNGLHRKKAPAWCTVAMRWHAFCSELVRASSCTCPVRIRWCPLDLKRDRTTTWHATGQPEVFRTLIACSADDYWQGTHGNWPITGVKRCSWDQTDDLDLAKLPTTSILNCGNLIITNYLIMIFICKPFQKFYFKLP